MSTPAAPAAPPSPGSVVPGPLRKDLVLTEQSYLGRKFLILKNPIGLNYFRLPMAHAEAARRFDGKRTFGQILQDLKKEDRYWRALSDTRALEELTALARQLAMGGLTRIQGGSAVARARQMKEAKAKRRFELTVGKILYIRKSLIDPDKLLTRMLPYFSWIYTPTTIALGTAFVLFTLVAALRHWDDIVAHSVNFFTFENLSLTWVVFFGVKSVHEFGHGLTCKKFGGEVHEMGFMFILFTPYLFCNVSDAWRATKSQRIYVTAAGICVELFLASIATWLWLGTEKGLFHQMCFNTMFLCSVSTILFNANPLMKFDGYYIMTDALEIPNLKQKSNTYVTQWAQKVLLGIRSSSSKLISYENNPLFGLYAVLSYLYGWLILYRISIHLFDALKPYGLEALSRTYVGLFLFVSLALPLYRLARSVKNSPDLKRAAGTRGRFILLSICGLIGLSFLVPWNSSIKRTIVIEHSNVEFLTPQHEGFLRELDVHDGQQVKKGDVLGRLEDGELVVEKLDTELQLDLNETKYRAAVAGETREIQQTVGTYQKMIHELEEELKGVNQKLDSMTLRAPEDGIIRTWHIDKQAGLYFAKGKPIGEMGENSHLRAIIPLDERQARKVTVGQKVVFRLFAEPGKKLEGRVTSRPVSPLERFTSPVMANLFGGDVPAEMDPDPAKGVRPSLPHYEAEVAIETPAPWLRAGMTGKARISTGSTTLGLWLSQKVLDYINPEMRL